MRVMRGVVEPGDTKEERGDEGEAQVARSA